jgi:hypothetical protein
MGNKVAMEFHAAKLGHGSLDGTEAELIVPEMVIHGKNSTTIVENEIRQGLLGKNDQLMARHFICHDTEEMLFQVDYKLNSRNKRAIKKNPRSIASDIYGCVLYVDKKIVMPDGQKRTMIYKTCPMYPNQPATKDDVKVDMINLYVAAVVFDCRQQTSQNAACACLSVVTGPNTRDDTGFELHDLYRAIKIPKVKNGVLVVDMNGQAVGKSASVPKEHCFGTTGGPCFDASNINITSSRMSDSSTATTALKEYTVYEIAPGAEAAAVIAVASSLF